MNLVIVESPTKAKTIGKFLGKDYEVVSSFGHIRDLPRGALGVDVDNNFEPKYVIPTKARSVVKSLKDAAKKKDKIILATDEDREGEAISWHLIQALGLNDAKDQPSSRAQVEGKSKIKNIERIVFHEITKSAIENALTHPRDLDLSLVDAQQARRVLDRLVGYKLSPFLWKKVAAGLSAGRVQSVAVRLIVERENEIRVFKPEEYWTIVAALFKDKDVEAELSRIDGEALDKFAIKDKDQAEKIAADLRTKNFVVSKVERKEVTKNPPPPFITSTLQQESVKRLGYSSKKTMFLAQRLYENGFITYMRTDSVNLSQEALGATKIWLEKNLGAAYAADAPRKYSVKSRLAQEAHEAIRPTHVDHTPDDAEIDGEPERKLYRLIWQRFVASQMPLAKIASTSIEISADKYDFRATGQMVTFDGYLKVWPQKLTEKQLPALKDGDQLELKDILPEQHFTEPLARYSEASLIKALEEHGIGRPSTYAPTISTIQDRNYVKKEKGRFFPTEIGEMVNKVLADNFPDIVDINFTAHVEGSLDAIAEGKEKWQDVIGAFYLPFAKNLEEKYEEVKKAVVDEKTDEICEKCDKPMIIKFGRFGKFMACSGFPDCKNTKRLAGVGKEEPKKIGMVCPKCGTSEGGEIVERRVSRGRAKGKIFWGCSRYPKCDYASWDDPRLPAGTSAKEGDQQIKKEDTQAKIEKIEEDNKSASEETED